MRYSPFILLFVLFLSGCHLIIGAAAMGGEAASQTGSAIYDVGDYAVRSTGLKEDESGVVVKNNRALEVEHPASVHEIYNTAYFVFQEMEFTEIEGQQSEYSAQLSATDPYDDRINLTLQRSEDQKTQIELRVGAFGDLGTSEQIYNKILGILDEAES